MKLKYIKKKKYYKYKVYEEFRIRLKNMPEDFILNIKWYSTIINNILYAYNTYAWDGCTFPAIQTNKTKIAGLVHDLLYQYMRLGLINIKYRKWADQVFRDILKEKGFMFPNLYYIAVRLFGKKYAMPDKKKYKIYIAS